MAGTPQSLQIKSVELNWEIGTNAEIESNWLTGLGLCYVKYGIWPGP